MRTIFRSMIKGAYFLISLFVFLACQPQQKPARFEQVETLYRSDLQHCIAWLDSLKGSTEQEAIEARFFQARRYFKFAEPVLAFAEAENYRFLNQPNILKVEEEDLTDIKVKEPSGFQVMEELIFAEQAEPELIQKHAAKTSDRLKLILKNTDLNHYQSYHFLWLFRQAIQRVALTGTTGFDAPVPAAALSESRLVYLRLQDYMRLFEDEFNDPELLTKWEKEFERTAKSLDAAFESFDRYAFIKNHTHRQMNLWLQTKDDWGVKFPFELAVKNDARTLFSENTFNLKYFEDHQSKEMTEEVVLLGKQLFNDTRLSASGEMSCATCHDEALAFTDGLKVSEGQKRNSPTLAYAALQQGFFYDKRAGSLEGQIVSVVKNETEFHSDLKGMEEIVMADADYKDAFSAAYPEGLKEQNIRHAIASYIRSLAPFDSKFDRNIRGEEESLTDQEIHGFNLFMGKAQCATCHFAPVFNGTVPPNFAETELELIGVPAQNDTVDATIDPDPGRYELFGTENRRHFFKTPTIRNIALTAPYMHNGVYETLEEVMDFYNRGGGAGIGIQQEYQTLPTDPLDLTQAEIDAVIAFMHTLTDSRYEVPQEVARR